MPSRKPVAGPQHEIIYGVRAVLAALANPRRQVLRLVVSENAADRHREAIAARGIAAETVPTAEISRLLPRDAVHQGMALMAAPLPPVALEDIAEAGLVVALDQVTDPHNVGAIMRSCAAFGADALLTTTRNSPASSGLLAKTASGGAEHVPLVRVANLARALDQLGRRGYQRLGLDGDAADVLNETDGVGPVVVVLGSEGKGLRRLTREHCDRLVRLDVPGPITSLNVSNAAAVALYTLTRARARSAD